jgi:hypothetical protein
VPVVDPSNVLVDLGAGPVPMRVGLRRPRLVVLAGDPLAATGRRGVTVVADECALLDALRSQLLDRHLLPLARRAHGRRRLGVRPLLGTVAAGVANAVVRTGGTVEQVTILLDALGIADLVEVGGDPPVVRRQTCCLAFTLPRPRLCASCCLRR